MDETGVFFRKTELINQSGRRFRGHAFDSARLIVINFFLYPIRVSTNPSRKHVCVTFASINPSLFSRLFPVLIYPQLQWKKRSCSIQKVKFSMRIVLFFVDIAIPRSPLTETTKYTVSIQRDKNDYSLSPVIKEPNIWLKNISVYIRVPKLTNDRCQIRKEVTYDA